MHERAETWSEANPDGRWRCFGYDELLKRDKLSLDLFWIKDRSLTDTDALPAPDIIAAEIADDLEAALEQFTKIATRLAQAADIERQETVAESPPMRQIALAEMAAKESLYSSRENQKQPGKVGKGAQEPFAERRLSGTEASKNGP